MPTVKLGSQPGVQGRLVRSALSSIFGEPAETPKEPTLRAPRPFEVVAEPTRRVMDMVRGILAPTEQDELLTAGLSPLAMAGQVTKGANSSVRAAMESLLGEPSYQRIVERQQQIDRAVNRIEAGAPTVSTRGWERLDQYDARDAVLNSGSIKNLQDEYARLERQREALVLQQKRALKAR